MPRHCGSTGSPPAEGGDGVLTHCNAGPLATSRYGTALGPILLAGERGSPCGCSPTRPGPCSRGAAHRLGAASGGGGRHPDL